MLSIRLRVVSSVIVRSAMPLVQPERSVGSSQGASKPSKSENYPAACMRSIGGSLLGSESGAVPVCALKSAPTIAG